MRKLLLTAIAVLSAFVAFGQTSIRVEAPKVVAADEQFNVTFIIEGGDKPTDFQWSSGSDFQVLWGPQSGHSTSIQMINGKTTRSEQYTYTYVLRPTGSGKFNIPAASARIKGNEIYSESVSIQVAAGGSSSSQSSSSSSAQSQQSRPSGQSQSSAAGIQDNDIFLKLELSRSKVVVGEPIIATLKLYQRVNIGGFENVTFPTFNGFWSQEIEAPTNIEFEREVLDGQIYNSALLRKFVIIPQHDGQIKIDPAEMVCLINIRVSPGGMSIFDGFFDDYRTVRKKVTTGPVTVDVSPLPAGAPASFGGGVGSFNISATMSRDSLKTHEAASLLVTISGRGNVSLLEAPKVKFPLDMEVYDTKVSEKVDKNGLSGSKYYEFPFIPRSHGEFVIDPIKYSYYDVDQNRYVTLETAPITVNVARGNEVEAGGVVVSGPSQKDVRTLGSDIRFISTKNPDLMEKGRFMVGSALFWIMSVLIAVLAFVSWLLFRHMAARRADVVGTKNRKATKMALKRLQLADTFLGKNLYTAFYEELHKALLGFISDKLNIPVAELSKDRISESLAAEGVDAGSTEKLIGILDACEFARYAPDAGHDAMAAHYAEAVDVISSIDSNMKGQKNVNRTTLAVLMLLMLVPGVAQAQSESFADSLWNSANAAYADGRWAAAVSDYEMISTMGIESASLYCNTGDAYFKDGNVPMAIVYYERALKLDPSYDDARYNLELMNAMIQDRIDPVPEFILKVWARDICYIMDSNAWAVLFLVFLALTFAMVLLFVLAPTAGGRRTGFFVGIVMLVFAVMSVSFSLWQKKDYMSADEAVVMRPVTSVKSSPAAESSTDLFILHEGTKVKIIDSVGRWNNIELADGRQGWLPSEDIEVI